MAELSQDLTDLDPAAQVEFLTQAMTFALLMGTDHQYPIPVHEVAKMADLLYRCGVTQGPPRDPDIVIDLPGWLVEGTREAQQEAPVAPDVTAPAESALVGVAPAPPKKIPKKLMGVVASDA